MPHIIKNGNHGFSLVEILVASTVGLVVLTALSSTFVLQQKRYRVQEQVIGTAQSARAAMDVMSREILIAGYDPSGTMQRTDPSQVKFVGIPYSTSQLEIIADLNGNGSTVDTNEKIIYAYYDETNQIKRKVGNGNFQPFAENISGFSFEYRKGNGDSTTTTEDIRQIHISITARSENPDPDTGAYRETELEVDLIPRNLGLEKVATATTTTTTVTTTSGTTTDMSTTAATTTDETTTLATPTEETTTEATTTDTSTTGVPTTDDQASTTIPDTSGPTIGSVARTPSTNPVPKNVTVQICADITDPSGVSSVVLDTNLDNPINMNNTAGDRYCGMIPKHNNQSVTYSIIAQDSRGNTSTSSGSYSQQN